MINKKTKILGADFQSNIELGEKMGCMQNRDFNYLKEMSDEELVLAYIAEKNYRTPDIENGSTTREDLDTYNAMVSELNSRNIGEDERNIDENEREIIELLKTVIDFNNIEQVNRLNELLNRDGNSASIPLATPIVTAQQTADALKEFLNTNKLGMNEATERLVEARIKQIYPNTKDVLER